MARTIAVGTRLVLASHNQGKLREILELLAPLGVEVVSAGALGLPEPDETEDSFEGNARIKALAAANASGLPALSDDSGFCVGALGGAPGVVSALWAGPGKDFAPAMARVRREMGDSSSACSALPGRTATPNASRAGWTGRWLCRRAAPTAMATTRCSCPRAVA